jgi:hypothetical protein
VPSVTKQAEDEGPLCPRPKLALSLSSDYSGSSFHIWGKQGPRRLCNLAKVRVSYTQT